jgi:hypothetical protein
MDDVCAIDVARHLQIDTKSCKGGIRFGELRRNEVRRYVVLVTRLAKRAHPNVGVVAAERTNQLGDVYTGSPIDLRRVFTAEKVDSHP